jgi:hypothetical protein
MSAARWPYCDGNGWGAEIVKVGGAESTTRVVDPSKDDERALAVFAQTQVKLSFYQGRTCQRKAVARAGCPTSQYICSAEIALRLGSRRGAVWDAFFGAGA